MLYFTNPTGYTLGCGGEAMFRRGPIYLADVADGLLPYRCRHRTFAVLRAYFDESGIHADSRTTVLCGFIGSRGQWRRTAHKWHKVMKGRVFHYKNMRTETQLIEKLAIILDDSGLEAVNGAFLGDWDRAIKSGAKDWPTRFPSSYQFVLEMCIQRMEQYSKILWNNEPIALTFSRQDQYAKFAEEIWRDHRNSGMWDHIVGFAFGDPELPELQTADMLAYEAFQCSRQVYERGDSVLATKLWENWPLVKRLAASKRLMLGSLMSERTLIETLTEQDKNRRYLNSPKDNTPR